MQKLLITFIIPFLLLCKEINNSKEDKRSILQNFSLMAIRNNRATISGTAVKGIIKNGTVTINPLSTDGSCNTSAVLAMDETDDTGNYSILYNKIGGTVCLTVSANANGKTTVFDEKLNADISIDPSSSFKLVSILPESRITSNNRKNTIVSPFSKMLGKRLQYLVKQAGAGADTNGLFKKAGKEVVIRFGLSSGLSSASSGKSITQTKATTATITDTDYPELDDILIELENPSSPVSAKFISILTGFSYLANKHRKGGIISVDDIDSILDAFATDFEDGLFDGKGSDGKAITIGAGANQITFSSTPLTTTLLPAIVSYVNEGGKLSAGRPTTTNVSITSSQITSQVQFVDNTPITSTIPLGSGQTFTVGGTITGLTASGLVLQNNAGDNLTVASGATSFTFSTALASGAAYAVTVQTQPTGQTCIVSSGTGTASANVTNVSVACLSLMGGTMQGAPLSLTGTVTTPYGPAQGTTTAGDVVGIGNATSFNQPNGITTDGTDLYIADMANHKIKKVVLATGTVSVFAGTSAGDQVGIPSAALFNSPRSITSDGANLYVADQNNHKIKKIVISTGFTSVLSGPTGSVTAGDQVGAAGSARFNNPMGITTDGTNVYTTEANNSKIKQIVIATGATSILAGPGVGDASTGSTDGTGAIARFTNPYGITTDGTNLYVCDSNSNKIRKIEIATAVVTTLAGSGTSGNADGTGTAATFAGSSGIITDGTNLYVSEPNNKIRKIVIATTVVTTLAGPGPGTTTAGDSNGTGTAARFSNPQGIVSDGKSIYVGEANNHKIRKID